MKLFKEVKNCRCNNSPSRRFIPSAVIRNYEEYSIDFATINTQPNTGIINSDYQMVIVSVKAKNRSQNKIMESDIVIIDDFATPQQILAINTIL